MMARRGNISPLSPKLAKVGAIFIIFCFAECAAGSCLSYGHACWGAHGKRSGNTGNANSFRPELTPAFNKELLNGRWFLSKLIQGPFDLRDALVRDQMRGDERQVFETVDTQKGADELLLDTDVDPDAMPLRLNKRKAPKLMVIA